ncbi:tRNA uridine 5-carboxymethylaminomethyl modification enzyme MnmG [Striga asiatica]|uniref:tRNA uridine 5-carboxymethylaminomethyl modification enzyme MnmG n=1 Tax=Striga asiatica TaxID=4170 RepID=A0A5A7PHY3_STRAF|nr:tRNA uridine 5-carboxymethylaminomethyl modification enzyme MnmG [Striga asiatica]
MAAITDSTSDGASVRRRRRRPPPKTLHWLADVIARPARALAGSILTAVFSESEESSSDWDDESDSDDGDPDNLPLPEISQHRQESQVIVHKTENKQLIEKLIMQESFSREEYTGLIEVLNSRVTPSVADNGANIFNQAAQDARKWFQEKKKRSIPVTNSELTGADKVEPAIVDTHSTEISGTRLTELAKSRKIMSNSSPGKSTVVSNSIANRELLRETRKEIPFVIEIDSDTSGSHKG